MKNEKTIIHLEQSEEGFDFNLNGEHHEMIFLIASTCYLNTDFEMLIRHAVEVLDGANVMEDIKEYAEGLRALAAEQKAIKN